MGRGALAVVMFLAAAEGFVFQGFVTFLPAFLAEGGVGQAAAAKGGVLAAAVLLLGVPGQLLGGRLAETGPRTLALRYATLYGGAVLAGLSVSGGGRGVTLLGVALAGLFSLLIFLGQPITNQLVARSTRAGRRGAAYGTYFSLSFGIGALAGAAGGWWPTGRGWRPCSASWGWSPWSTPSAGWPVACWVLGRQAGPRRPSVSWTGRRIDREDVDMAMADRQAHTLWEGPLIGGKGDTEFASSGIGRYPVTWAARTESPDGKTSPGGAARRRPRHLLRDGVFRTSFQAGNPPERLHVTSTVSLDPKEGGGVVVTRSALEVNAVPGYDQDGFQQAAEEAEQGCPISNAIRGNPEITVKATPDS